MVIHLHIIDNAHHLALAYLFLFLPTDPLHAWEELFNGIAVVVDGFGRVVIIDGVCLIFLPILPGIRNEVDLIFSIFQYKNL